MAVASKSNEIRITREYDAPVDAVWDAWTDTAQVAQWWGPRGFTTTTSRFEMKPGGVHVMLMGLKAPLKEGESIVITLTFEKAGKLDVTVPVGGVAASGHDHGHSDTGSSSGG